MQAGNEMLSRVYEGEDGVVVGHVAVHDYTARSVMETAAEAAGLPANELAAVARLFVDAGARRVGIGRRLLDTAASLSCDLGRRPVLDVWERFEAAVALYQAAGWDRVGLVDIRFRSPCSPACVHDGNGIRSFVFVGPEPPSVGGSPG